MIEIFIAVGLMGVFIWWYILTGIFVGVCMAISYFIDFVKDVHRMRTQYGVDWKTILIKTLTFKVGKYMTYLYIKEEAEEKEKRKKLEREKRKKRLEQKRKKEEQKVLTTAKAEK